MEQPKSVDHREMARRSNDRLRVINPTNEDFVVTWDSFKHIIPSQTRDLGYGKGQTVLPRYLANNYFTHMVDKLINDEASAKIAEENTKRVNRGQEKMTSWQEQLAFETKFSTGNFELRKKFMAMLWGGVEEEYGLEAVTENEYMRPVDTRPISDQLMETFEKQAPNVPDITEPGFVETETETETKPENAPESITDILDRTIQDKKAAALKGVSE